MNYEDFPILSNQEYELINSHFSKREKFDRKTILNKICNELIICKNICLESKSKYNKKICSALEKSLIILNKLNQNISSCFNIVNSQSQTMKIFNLFDFMKKLISISSLVFSWFEHEPKEYYKNLAGKTNRELLQVMENIISALNNSNIITFKHM